MWKKCLLLLYLLILSKYDYREKQVPSVLLYIGIGTAGLLWVKDLCVGQITSEQILGIVPGIFLLIMAAVTQKAGMADGAVLVVVGAVLGYRDAMLIFCISLMLFCVVSIILLFFHKIRMKEAIPYLPFLAVAVTIEHVV